MQIDNNKAVESLHWAYIWCDSQNWKHSAWANYYKDRWSGDTRMYCDDMAAVPASWYIEDHRVEWGNAKTSND